MTYYWTTQYLMVGRKMLQSHLFTYVSELTIVRYLMVLCVLVSISVWAEPLDRTNQQLLDESEYRTGLEEVVVVGKQPQWRQPQQEPWRTERFELSAQVVSKPRIQWFPEYDKDEREFYQGVRDRTGEEAEIKIFEWKF